MQQIAEWLAKIGLERYTPVFVDNDIDVEVLRYLTDGDLKKIGVSLGHRRKLLAAIAELGGGAATLARPPSELNKQEREPTPTPVVEAPSPPFASAEAAGERRYLTVMFCDLVDSTGIAAKLDAEEWRDLVNAYLDDASAAVAELGGHVAKKLGDGLMALFGYPVAHENDAERAAEAALSIQRGSDAKEIAQVGAAIGREFSYELLALVTQKSDVELRSVLERFSEAGLMFRRGVPPEATFLFKHALVRDAAYGTLLRHQRQQLHGRIVAVLEGGFPEVFKIQPETLAHHCAEAGSVAQAVEYYVAAAQRATASSNNTEAGKHLETATALVEALPPSDPGIYRLRQRLAMGGWWWRA
jgi:SAM domain (Sterile alpha motif)/Adenylate and Guanylate cyclase catalytic domain